MWPVEASDIHTFMWVFRWCHFPVEENQLCTTLLWWFCWSFQCWCIHGFSVDVELGLYGCSQKVEWHWRKKIRQWNLARIKLNFFVSTSRKEFLILTVLLLKRANEEFPVAQIPSTTSRFKNLCIPPLYFSFLFFLGFFFLIDLDEFSFWV